ncbi:AraC family transcriptional regulator [Pseudomethylobacillus aquaticus]|uniref:AraC family transcriptional regulator n=1 Tax=Pseudomethylobacillus aquaticus TaxID=2676064 RepID=A0A3N0V357_9PROT|nr:GyrI-like domain-containing protein [Pseudomethylobacillus aquaticus]ROH86984.1 AraC family transcriptional regulator [Pseudomethylobacillus aquaticus]
MKKQLPYFLLVFAIPVVGVLWWWGMFSSASVEVAERGPYRYAYLEAEGPYSKLGNKQQEVLFELEKQGITPGVQLTLMLSDPRSTPYKELRAQTGYLLAEGVQPQPPLQVASVPVRHVAVARIKAHPLFAYGKAYSALLDFSGQLQLDLQLPTVELSEHSVLTVEMPLPENASMPPQGGRP